MKLRLLLIPAVCFSLLVFSALSTYSQTVVTFDDLSETASGSFIANGYRGLNWSGFGALNGVLNPTINSFVTNGYYYGMVSASNVALNASGNPAEIDSAGTNFNFLSVYLTGAWNSNLNIQVEGFRNGSLLYDTTVVASATNPTLFAFNYLNIDRLYFNSFGGQAAFNGPAEHFAMDNLTLEFVPEPSTLLLAGFGALTLWPFLKRRRS